MSGAQTSPFPLRKIAVIGPGLIGGAILWKCREENLASSLSAYARQKAKAPLQAAFPGVAFAETPAEAVAGADLLFLCTPIDRMESLVREVLPTLPPSAVVTDVGSVKGPVVAQLAPLLGKRWIGGHPMAGREKGGFDPESAPVLFQDKTVLLTPTAETDPTAVALVRAFWEAVGGRVECLTPEEHDRRTAQISHLPHLVAAALAAVVDDASLHAAGPGFRDTTRIAAGPAAMWREILLANREEVGGILATFINELKNAEEALRTGDADALQALLEKANDTRRKLEAISPSPHKTP